MKAKPKTKPLIQHQPANREVYASERWKQTSERHRRENPLCVQCLTEKVFTDCSPGTRNGVTDHIVPINAGGNVWDETNYQTMCHRHHNVKRNAERGTTGKK